MKVFIEVCWTQSYGGIEFPPAPTRLLQAIIAATVDRYTDLLKHLETTLPVIYATKDPAVLEFKKFVPNNDENLNHINASSQRKYIMRRSDSGLRAVYEYDIDPRFFADLQSAAREIHTLGISGDLVIARACEASNLEGLDRYEESKGGTVRLFTPVAGFIDSVFARYEKGAALRLQHSFFAKNPTRRGRALFSLTNPVAAEYASLLVSWIRHAAMSLLPDISGHGDHSKRLVIVPAITTYYSDNMIRRVIISTPDEISARQTEAKMAALHLIDETGEDRGYLVPSEHDAVYADYTGTHRLWRSITPVIGAYDNGDQKQRLRNITKLFPRAELPIPQRVKIVPRKSAHFVNARHREFPRFFIEAEFKEPVSGPVLLGRGRFTGLGVFAAVNR